jgi:hypothetical protein
LEDMLEEVDRRRQEADATVSDWQRSLQIGDYYFLMYDLEDCPLSVYGQILDPLKEADPDELEYLKDLYSSEHMKNYKFSRVHSPIVPDGELGDVHLSSMVFPLTESQFMEAKELGWPQDRSSIRKILLKNPHPELLNLIQLPSEEP